MAIADGLDVLRPRNASIPRPPLSSGILPPEVTATLDHISSSRHFPAAR